MNAKQELRNRIIKKRKELVAREVERHSSLIVENLLRLPEIQAASTIALYLAIGNEVNLESLYTTCWHMEKRTFVPVFSKEEGCYAFTERIAETALFTGKHGILEPRDPDFPYLERIDVMVVPGIAFDRSGNRLGRGGGYYDRLLSGFDGFSVGAAYDFQIVESIPADMHDIPVQAVVTESQIVKV